MGWLSSAIKKVSNAISGTKKKKNNSSSYSNSNSRNSSSSYSNNNSSSRNSSSSSRNSSSNVSAPSWQDKLNSYKTNTNAGYSEINRAKQVYEQKKKAGDMKGAQAANNWANQIRNSMGISNQYNSDGSKKSTSSNNNIYSRPTPNTNTYSKPTAKTYNPYSGKYADTINNASKKYGLDPNLIASVITRESSFNPNAKSSAGAGGLMQLMPGTARGLGVNNVYDPIQNIDGGANYLKQMIDRAGGDVNKALAYYNAGPNRKKIPGESIQYANNVLSTFKQLTGQDYKPGSIGANSTKNIQGGTWEDKINSLNGNQDYINSEIARTQGVINGGNAQNIESAQRYLNQLYGLKNGANSNDVMNGNYDNYMKTNDYAHTLGVQDRFNFYKDNKDAYNQETNRVQDVLKNGGASDPVAANRYWSQLQALNDGKGIDDIMAGMYDNYAKVDDSYLQNSDLGEFGSQIGNTLVDKIMGYIENQQNPDVAEQQLQEVISNYKDFYQDVPDTYSYNEALGIAQDQINPLYDVTLKDALKRVDNNNLSRGFFGQMPGAELERSTASDIEAQRALAQAQLANSLKGQSEQYAQGIIQSNMQTQQNQLAAMLQSIGMKQGLSQGNINNMLGMLGYLDDKDYKEWQKGVTESEITGQYKGEPTVAYQRMLQEMGLKEEEAKREAEYNSARIQKIYSDVELGWEKLKNDDAKIAQAAQRIGISSANLKLSKQKYASSILEKAQTMASKYFKDSDNFEDGEMPTADQYESRVRYYTDYLQGKTSGNADDKKVLEEAKKNGALK